MPKLRNIPLFLSEFLRTHRTTGAVLPSSRWLAAALTRNIEKDSGPLRILEVGPGTGAVTATIVRLMRDQDRLDLVELNERFVSRLKERFEQEPAFSSVADRTEIFHCKMEELEPTEQYDVIISGLPLNNFTREEVERILTTLMTHLKPDGMLSFFEYIAIRKIRSIVSNGSDRKRLREVGKALSEFLTGREIRRDAVFLNVPPAWVHHIRNRP